MTRGTRTTAFALAGAVALASGAYALGSQAGDGAAAAAKTTNAPGYGPPPGGPGPGFGHGDRDRGEGLSTLATRLGVDEAALHTALDDIAKAHRADFAQKLADALGIDRAKVDAALANAGPKDRAGHPPDEDRRNGLAKDLADALNLSVDKVQAALDKQRDHRGDPAALAQELGVTTAKLRQALANVFRDHGPRGHDGDPGARLDPLAKALGVTPAKLDAAFQKLRADRPGERDAFAQELADRLKLDVAKVKAALPDRLGRHHP